jgi:hypothetical protein
MQMERLPNPKGDRVKITMSGKFLPFKYYGNSGNVPGISQLDESKLDDKERLNFSGPPFSWNT